MTVVQPIPAQVIAVPVTSAEFVKQRPVATQAEIPSLQTAIDHIVLSGFPNQERLGVVCGNDHCN